VHRALPAPLRLPVMVALAYVDLLFSVGRGGQRRLPPGAADRPALDPSDRLVWKGRAGHALIVSDRSETEAIAQLRTRSLWRLGIGAALCCWGLYELLTML